MSLRLRRLPTGFVPPCLPSATSEPPSGADWLHEIKHDGFRIIARKEGKRVRLYSRPGNDLTHRFTLIVDALSLLRARSCILDGEAVACGEDGIALFEHIRYRHHDASVFMWAFDLVELNGDDLRREPLERRKATLATMLARADCCLHRSLASDQRVVFEMSHAAFARSPRCAKSHSTFCKSDSHHIFWRGCAQNCIVNLIGGDSPC